MPPVAASRREYALALLAGAVGAGLILLAVRQRWAEAVFTPPKPLSPQVVAVSGADLVPLAAALALAALAGLAAVIATRGVLRRAAGVLLAAFGAVAGAAVTARVSAASVLSVAASSDVRQVRPAEAARRRCRTRATRRFGLDVGVAQRRRGPDAASPGGPPGRKSVS